MLKSNQSKNTRKHASNPFFAEIMDIIDYKDASSRFIVSWELDADTQIEID